MAPWRIPFSLFLALLSPRALGASAVEIIPTARGCEDFAFDADAAAPRLILSCSERRDPANPMGGLYALNLENHQLRPLALAGIELESFHPHGISLTRGPQGARLYVINHQAKKQNSRKRDFSQVLVFDVVGDRLNFVADLGAADGAHLFGVVAFGAPNDLVALEDGQIFLTNPASPHPLLRYSPHDHRWTTAATGMIYPNGVHVKGERLYLNVSDRGHQFAYDLRDGRLSNRRVHARRLGAVDNITESVAGDLLYPGAVNVVEYFRYFLNESFVPRSRVFRDRGTELQQLDFSELSETISSPSVSYEYRDRLYLGQVFENFVAVIHHPTWGARDAF